MKYNNFFLNKTLNILSNIPIGVYAFILSIVTSIYLIYDYGVVNNHFLEIHFAKEALLNGNNELFKELHITQKHFFHLIYFISDNLGISDYIVAYGINIICHSLIAFLLINIALELNLAKSTCFALLFLLLSHPSYNNFRSTILSEPLYWSSWLAALWVLMIYHKKHVVVTSITWFLLFLFGFFFNLSSWLWLAFFPIGILLLKEWRTRPVFYALLGYFSFILCLLLIPYDGQNLLGWLFDSSLKNISITQSKVIETEFFWANEGDSFSVWVYFLSGSLSLILIKLILSLGIVNSVLFYYAGVKKQIQLANSHKFFLIYIIFFDIFANLIATIFHPKSHYSVSYFSTIFILLLISSLGLSHMIKKAQNGRYQHIVLLVFVWCAVGYIASGFINFGPNKSYIRSAGEYMTKSKIEKDITKPVYSNNNLFLFYAEEGEKAYLDIKNITSSDKPFYYGYELNRKKELPNELKNLPVLISFKNDHNDKFILFEVN